MVMVVMPMMVVVMAMPVGQALDAGGSRPGLGSGGRGQDGKGREQGEQDGFFHDVGLVGWFMGWLRWRQGDGARGDAGDDGGGDGDAGPDGARSREDPWR